MKPGDKWACFDALLRQRTLSYDTWEEAIAAGTDVLLGTETTPAADDISLGVVLTRPGAPVSVTPDPGDVVFPPTPSDFGMGFTPAINPTRTRQLKFGDLSYSYIAPGPATAVFVRLAEPDGKKRQDDDTDDMCVIP